MSKPKGRTEPDIFIAKAASQDSVSSRIVAQSKAVPDDPFANMEGILIEPPIRPDYLIRLVDRSTALTSCIDTIVTNVPGFGYGIDSVFSTSPPDELKEEVEKELIDLENDLLAFARGKSLTELRKELMEDEEKTGNAYMELIRNVHTGRIVAGKRLPSSRTRLIAQDQYKTEFEWTVVQYARLEESPADYKTKTIKVPDAKNFRRYVEAPGHSHKPVYFKEYLDPRVIDNETGEVIWSPGDPESKLTDFLGTGEEMPESRKASEVYHFGGSAGAPYGSPRWISALNSAIGITQAEDVNYSTLDNNGVPSFVISVSGGRLTQGSVDRIKQFVENHVKNSASYSTFLILEGETGVEGDVGSEVKVTITPLDKAQIRDQLFGKYEDKAEERIYRVFRVPPIFMGAVGDYNRATADISRRLADEQVFAPERDKQDWFFNHVLFAEWGIKYHTFRTNTPNITDNRDLIALAVALERSGAMTPRIGRRLASEVFPTLIDLLGNISKVPEPDVPWSFTMANAVKNEANPTEVNQQVAPVMPSLPDDSTTTSNMKARAILKDWLEGSGDGIMHESAQRLLADYLFGDEQ